MAAFDEWARAAKPTTSDEIWRYSRVDELDLDRWAPLSDSSTTVEVPDAVRPLVDDLGDPEEIVVVHHGRISHHAVHGQDTLIGPVPDAGALGHVADAVDDAFLHLHDAFLVEPLQITIPARRVVEAPVVAVLWADAEGSATFPRLVIDAGDHAQATVVVMVASADVDALVVPVVEIRSATGAHLTVITIQTLGQKVWQLGRLAADVGRDSRVELATVALGGSYARLRSDTKLRELGGEVSLSAAYFGDRDQMHDFRTLQDHAAGRTSSDLLFKGAVDDEAAAVYSGLIRIRPGASGASAHQTNRTLTLSDKSWAESVPNLEILHDDVQCSHASAVGPIDEDQRFYLESRGIPPEAAEQLVITGFFEEVLTRLPADRLRARLLADLQAKFRHTSAQGEAR